MAAEDGNVPQTAVTSEKEARLAALKLEGEAEYERGYGAGPFGTREIRLFGNCFLNPVVSLGAAIALWSFVIKVYVDQEQSLEDFQKAQSWVTATFTWLYIISQDYWMAFLVPLVYYYGHVKLGHEDEKPQYSDGSYFAMVFCAGVAIGLVFYGASEPLWHKYGYNRYALQGSYNDNQMSQHGINVTLFHWGFQAWIVYCLTAVTMGFLSYKKGLPLCFRTTLAPLFGKAIWGWLGDLIDIVTIVTIVAGLCTSLGLGASQIVAGMQRLEWLDTDLDEKGISNCSCAVTGIITLFATISVICGLDYGIKTMSQTAFIMGNFILVTVLCLDQPWYIFNVMVQSIGFHLQYFVEISFMTDAFAQLGKGEGAFVDAKGAQPGANPKWMDWWTIFYWGWWIAWAPFVGTFLAAISRGRTIRQVVGYTLTVPFAYSVVWFCTFGGAGLRMDRRANFFEKEGLRLYNNSDYFLYTSEMYRPKSAGKCFWVPESLKGYKTEGAGAYVTNTRTSPVCKFSGADGQGYWFDLMNQYHGLGQFLSILSIITTALYFITSSDSGSLVVDLIAANGRDAHVVQRVFWALSEGAVAVTLLNAGGSDSLSALRAISIAAGLPFTIILMFMVTSLWRALKIDQGHMKPRAERNDWLLPLYAGVFDVIETVMSLGRAPLPKVSAIRDFAIALFCPSYIVFVSLRVFATKHAVNNTDERFRPTTLVQDALVSFACGLLYYGFWICHIMTWTGVKDLSGTWGIGWAFYVGACTLLAIPRHNVRLYFGIEGNGFEDWLTFLFLWPQAIAQMAEQTRSDVKPIARPGASTETAEIKDSSKSPANAVLGSVVGATPQIAEEKFASI
eukprot:TRINITY_DN80523_c0_g1_i1.p1 TRINITY_DN80523_c0_g1~~TRINITY_DN80523_c0_g1_i1.p1  ORF type:complete len:845 (-),score=145.11 TRINITY_DN80523_c0_g1_i1:92-2626(-)